MAATTEAHGYAHTEAIQQRRWRPFLLMAGILLALVPIDSAIQGEYAPKQLSLRALGLICLLVDSQVTVRITQSTARKAGEESAIDSYKIPQKEIRARIHLTDGQELIGSLHARRHVAEDFGEELLERLNDSDERFLVLSQGEAGATMIQKSAIVTLELHGEPRSGMTGLVDLRQFQVALKLTGGRAVEGFMSCSLPPERARLVDFLNSSISFVRLGVGGKTVLANRAHILTARDLAEG